MNQYNVRIFRNKYVGTSTVGIEQSRLLSVNFEAKSNTQAKSKATRLAKEVLLLENYLQHWKPEYIYERRNLYGRDIERWYPWERYTHEGCENFIRSNESSITEGITKDDPFGTPAYMYRFTIHLCEGRNAT